MHRMACFGSAGFSFFFTVGTFTLREGERVCVFLTDGVGGLLVGGMVNSNYIRRGAKRVNDVSLYWLFIYIGSPNHTGF